jgi:hypothetical protein
MAKRTKKPLELLHKGSLITYQEPAAEKETCLNYLMHFPGRGVLSGLLRGLCPNCI